MSDEVETAETPAPPALPDSPWANDLREYLGDNPEALAAADRYMREKQQPRMTELETASNAWRDLESDVRRDAQGTLAGLTAELLGEDVATQFTALFGSDGEDATAAQAAEVAEAAQATAPLDPDTKALVEWAKAKKQEEDDAKLREQGQSEYESVLGELRTKYTDLTDDDMELIHPFMASAGRDIDAAYAGYQAYTKAFRARNGLAESEAPAVPEAPAVLGGQAAPAAVPPTDPKYTKWGDIDAAFDDWRNERRAGDPPPVL